MLRVLQGTVATAVVGLGVAVVLLAGTGGNAPDAVAQQYGADNTPPIIVLTGLKPRVSLAAFRKGTRVRVTSNEAVQLEAALHGTVKSARLAAYELQLATATAALLTPGARTLTLRPKRRLVGTPRRAVKVRLRITATDAARNRRTLTRTITVTVPRRRR
jgi:hypothetical protein